MNDENCPPDEEDVNNLSMSSVKAGAAVFGSLVFGSEYPEHSLCYSPSPMVNRRNDENAAKRQVDGGKVLSFEKSAAASPKKPTEKAQRKKTVASKVEGRAGLRQKEPKSKVLPHRKNQRPGSGSGGIPKKKAGYKQQSASDDFPGGSVNPTINGVRRSKEENLREKMTSVAELRERRRLEREEVAAFNVKAEQTRREVLELRKRLNERFRQAKVDREQRAREERLARVEDEIQFKSRVHVEHKRTLKEQEDARRRMSTADRARLRRNHREGKERMRLMSIQEDQALYEERHESSVAIRNTKAGDAEKRRNSFAFRNGDARRIRELFAQREAERKHQEHESYELKWAGERDADEYKRQMAAERRDSFAFRNAEGQRIRDLESQMKADELHSEHESYELKWAGERDADDYKKQMEREKRDSFAFRNAEGQRIRDLEMQMKAEEQHGEHESYELKWAGERDADDYKRQMEQERRDSFAFRNAEGKRIRDLEAEMRADEQHNDHESYELKWAGERDADDYKKQMEEERRDSFAFRNAEGKRIRDLEAEMKANAQHAESESYELKWAGERDADDYKKQMDRERRDSFAFRNAEGQRIRDLEMQMKADAQQEEHESYELKWAGEKDADDYKRQMEEERRESLRFRNKEAARHDAVMAELRSLAQEKEHESYMLKWAGERDADDYKRQMEEERRDSFAFRNAEGKRHRDIDEQARVQGILENAQNEELNAACQRDVNQYKEDCAAKDRASLCLRRKEHFANRMQAENDRQDQLQGDHESHLLDTAAWHDVNEYVKECNRRKRLSLAFRAKEKRRHYQIEREQAELKTEQRHYDTFCRSEDARYMEMAKLKEKARTALAALGQSPKCTTFGANPFRMLLE